MLRSRRSPVQRRTGAAWAVGLLAAIALTGCTAGAPAATSSADPSGSASPPPGASASASATPAPSASAEPSPPFDVACDALLTPEQVYAFNPNFGAAPDYEPDATAVVGVVDAEGTACGWLNQTSGEVIEVAVATPSESALTAAGNQAASTSSAVPTYGTPPDVEGYFSRTGTTGTAQVFTGPYWVVLSSTEFFEPGDAAQLAEAVLGNLPPA
ncbi:iron ABC transporter ATP-binding protein [Agromyces sp. MMS24-K17]|uniref:iron ABC transporter ATP-binding protein n=1 Tax=Agromyces sp. MMS24-K17 TaxID=3372850 RepID=UPI00375431AC